MKIDPRSLENAVKVCLLAYPQLFPTREHVIHHLYCVLGNGYDWEGGALVERCDDEKHAAVVRMLEEGRSEEEIRAHIDKLDQDRWDLMYKELWEKFPHLKKEMRRPEGAERGLKVYPLSELCKILELPEDIRPDWLKGAEEALQIIKTRPGRTESETLRNRVKWLPRIRKLIEERRKSSGS